VIDAATTPVIIHFSTNGYYYGNGHMRISLDGAETHTETIPSNPSYTQNYQTHTVHAPFQRLAFTIDAHTNNNGPNPSFQVCSVGFAPPAPTPAPTAPAPAPAYTWQKTAESGAYCSYCTWCQFLENQGSLAGTACANGDAQRDWQASITGGGCPGHCGCNVHNRVDITYQCLPNDAAGQTTAAPTAVPTVRSCGVGEICSGPRYGESGECSCAGNCQYSCASGCGNFKCY
jgi:hypothetical protein